MVRNIYIRVDGNSQIGFGHFFRCLALGEMLCKNYSITFVSRSFSQNIKRIINKNGFSLNEIDSEEKFLSQLTEKEIVVVDGYHFDTSFYYKLKLKKVVSVSIQDVLIETENIDIIINHLPNLKEKYENQKAFVGPNFAIIRPEFLNNKKMVKTERDNFFISFGGTINYPYINKLIIILKELDANNTINILTTDENKDGLILFEGCTVYSNLNASDIVEIIDYANFCLITPGMILYEVLSRNKKAVVGSLNPEQNQLAKDFENLGIIKDVGLWENINSRKLIEAMKTENFDAKKIASIFDGKSTARILKIFKDL